MFTFIDWLVKKAEKFDRAIKAFFKTFNEIDVTNTYYAELVEDNHQLTSALEIAKSEVFTLTEDKYNLQQRVIELTSNANLVNDAMEFNFNGSVQPLSIERFRENGEVFTLISIIVNHVTNAGIGCNNVQDLRFYISDDKHNALVDEFIIMKCKR